jgi:hypothetical protein
VAPRLLVHVYGTHLAPTCFGTPLERLASSSQLVGDGQDQGYNRHGNHQPPYRKQHAW